jgi:hypothetical protein
MQPVHTDPHRAEMDEAVRRFIATVDECTGAIIRYTKRVKRDAVLCYVGTEGLARFIKTVAMHVLKFVAQRNVYELEAASQTAYLVELEAASQTAYLVNIVAALYVHSDMVLQSPANSMESTARDISGLLTLYGKGFSMIGPTWCIAMIGKRVIWRDEVRTEDTKLYGVGYDATYHWIPPATYRSVVDKVSRETAASAPPTFSGWQLLIEEGVHRAACAIVQSGFDADALHQLLRPGSGCTGIATDLQHALEVWKHANPCLQGANGQRVVSYRGDLIAAENGLLREGILDSAIASGAKIESYDVDLVLAGLLRFDDRRRVALKWLNLFDTAILSRLLRSVDICDNLVAAREFFTGNIPASHPVFASDRVERTCSIFAKFMVAILAAAATQPAATTDSRPDLVGLWDFGDARFPASWRKAVQDRVSFGAARGVCVNGPLMRALLSRPRAAVPESESNIWVTYE